jgi:hypothetical protein
MKFSVILLLLLAAAAYSQTKTDKRLTGLEKRVTKVENRVTRLEGSGVPASEAPERKEPDNPISVVFLKKVQQVGQDRVGIRLYMEFENLSRRRLYAFNGTLVFRNEKGDVIWKKPYGHTEPLASGEKVQVSIGILGEQAKEYLKFVKARAVTAELENQETYAAE